MENQFIALSEVIRIMDEGETFSITVVTANRARKTGGELLTIRNARKLGTYGDVLKDKKIVSAVPNTKKSKKPDHSGNFTRNLQDMSNGKTVKIHCRLITRFNEKRVRY